MGLPLPKSSAFFILDRVSLTHSVPVKIAREALLMHLELLRSLRDVSKYALQFSLSFAYGVFVCSFVLTKTLL